MRFKKYWLFTFAPQLSGAIASTYRKNMVDIRIRKTDEFDFMIRN